MAISLPKLALPKLKLPGPALDAKKKRLVAIVGGVVVLAVVAWFGWQYFAEEPAPPPAPVATKPRAVKPRPKPKAAVVTPQARDKLIADVLAASGLKQELDDLPGRLVAGVRQSGEQQKNMQPALIQAIENVVAESFTAEGFQNRISTALTKNFDQKHMQGVLKNFSSPAGKTLVELERTSQSPQDLAEFARGEGAKLAPEREALIKRIDAATKAGDLAVDLAFVSMKALALGLVGPGERKAEAVQEQIEQRRAEATDQIRRATLLSLAYSFRDVNDADLEKFAAICEAENSKWFYGQVYAALLAQVQEDAAEAGERIAKLEIKPTVVAKHGPKYGQDARECLALPTNAEIAKCAEAYR